MNIKENTVVLPGLTVECGAHSVTFHGPYGPIVVPDTGDLDAYESARLHDALSSRYLQRATGAKPIPDPDSWAISPFLQK